MKPAFSIVVPVFQNESNLPHTIAQLCAIESDLPGQVIEFLFINDGSTDASEKLLQGFIDQNSHHIQLIKFAKNFGQIAAIQAGLRAARGSCAAIISADLQDPPELLIEMFKKWRDGERFVIAVRESREDKGISTLFSEFYWLLVSKYALPGYPRKGFDCCLIDRQLIDIINSFTEKNTHIFPLIYSLGFQPFAIPYRRRLRVSGKSQWTFWKKIKLTLDTFIAFSYAPIRIISYIGISVATLSFGFGLFVLISYFALGNPYSGWSSLAILITGLSGLTLLTLGIIGEYLWRILDAVRRRPQYIIERTITSEGGQHKDLSH